MWQLTRIKHIYKANKLCFMNLKMNTIRALEDKREVVFHNIKWK